MADSSATHRRAVDAATRFRHAVAFLRRQAEHGNKAERWLAGYEAEALLWKVLFEAESLVDVLNEGEEAEDLLRFTSTLRDRLRARRLAAKLSNVAGRTPEEAAIFRAKAAEFGDVRPVASVRDLTYPDR